MPMSKESSGAGFEIGLNSCIITSSTDADNTLMTFDDATDNIELRVSTVTIDLISLFSCGLGLKIENEPLVLKSRRVEPLLALSSSREILYIGTKKEMLLWSWMASIISVDMSRVEPPITMLISNEYLFCAVFIFWMHSFALRRENPVLHKHSDNFVLPVREFEFGIQF